MSEFRAGFLQYLYKLFGDIDAITYLKPPDFTNRQILTPICGFGKKTGLSPPLTDFHRWLYVHVKLHATTSQMQPRRSVPDHDKAQKTDLKPLRLVKKWMKSSITIAASSVCKHEILADRLNKIQLRTVWCSIFYFFSKQTMNLLFHCTFAWICVDFSCKTAFISYHVTSAKTRVLKCCCLLFD